MRLENALAEIQWIQSHLASGQRVYCFQWLTTGLVGCLGLVAGALQFRWVPNVTSQPLDYLLYWLAIASTCGLLSVAEIAYRFRSASQLRRKQTWEAWLDFSPCLALGLLMSTFTVLAAPSFVAFVPSIWMSCFSLGLFSLRRKLPPSVVWVAIYFGLMALVSVRTIGTQWELSGWLMGIAFGGGHLALALILYQERLVGSDVT